MTARKKILYVITKSAWGGATRYTYDLAVNLSRAEFEVWLAAGPAEKNNKNLFGALQNTGVHCFTIKNFQKSVNPLKDIFAFFEILSLIKRIKPDIVHVSSSKAGGLTGIAIFFYKLLTLNFKLLTVFTAHGWAFHENRQEWQRWLIKLLSRLTVFFYDRVIVVSEFDRVSAIKNKIAPPKKFITIHNGINSNSLNFLNKTEAREKLLTPEKADGFWIGTIGEFTKNKGHKFLIKAAAKLAKKYPEIKFIIIGHRGEEKQKCLSLIDRYSLQNNVFLVDNRPDAAIYLKAFDVFILPSLKEGLPYALLEAGSAGLPTIASETGGNPEIIADQQSGLLIKPANAKEIIKAVEKLMTDNNLCQTLAKNLREKIIGEFSLKKQLEKTIEIYM